MMLSYSDEQLVNLSFKDFWQIEYEGVQEDENLQKKLEKIVYKSFCNSRSFSVYAWQLLTNSELKELLRINWNFHISNEMVHPEKQRTQTEILKKEKERDRDYKEFHIQELKRIAKESKGNQGFLNFD